MKDYEFKALAGDLCAYFERKYPSDHTVAVWLDECRDIPTEALEWVKQEVKRTCDTFPKNLPKNLWALFHDWLKSHPEKAAVDYGCAVPECNQGLLHVIRRDDKMRITPGFVFRCSQCSRSKLRGLPAASLATLIANGYELDTEAARAQYRPEPREIKISLEAIDLVAEQLARQYEERRTTA